MGGSNYCIEITVNDKGKWEGQVISTFDAYRIVRAGGLRQLRHPTLGQNGKALAMRLVIGDSVRLEASDKVQTLRVAKMSAAGQVFMAEVNEANVDARNRSGELAYVSKMAGSFQKAKARPVTISPIGELRDPGFKG